MPSPSSSTPFYGAPSSGGALVATSSHQRLALDNLIRRELRVSDPNDPQQIANALLERFKEDPRAKAIAQEARGLPFLLSTPVNGMSTVQAPTSSDAELQQAKDDVERDLQELLSNSLLKDVTPEIRGWAQAVRSAIAEGTVAARFALDTRQRDKAFSIRRKLGDYARLARLVGALTPTLNLTYRRFAQSLDEVAALLLVIMGEALATAGFSGGRFLLQVPYSELPMRRDIVIAALRNFTGSAQGAYAPNEYQRGLHAYRTLTSALDTTGHGDLRVLLSENELSRMMDELIQRAQHGNVEGLRALGATAQLDLQHIRRLIIVGQDVLAQGLETTDSPEFVSFLDALLMFAEAFNSSGGIRLLRIARPPVLFYGLYGIGGQQLADQRLLNLVIERGNLAEKLDCLMLCGCDPATVRCQIVLDKVLYDVDRSIDLYALGNEDLGEPELRAAAYSLLIDKVIDIEFVDAITYVDINNGSGTSPKASLERLAWLLRPCSKVSEANAPTCQFAAGSQQAQMWEQASQDAWVTIFSQTTNRPLGKQRFLVQELCAQMQVEESWKDMVSTMAPSCYGPYSAVHEAILTLLRGAADKIPNKDNFDERCQLALHVAPTPAFSQDRIGDLAQLIRETWESEQRELLERRNLPSTGSSTPTVEPRRRAGGASEKPEGPPPK